MYTHIRLLIIVALFAYTNKLCSQKDTLHIYYQGLQTAVADSSYAKITKWAKSIKGTHSDVEIYAYYDNGDFKKYMKERVENLEIVVIRLARDYITIKSSAPVKGKKSQRTLADIVYTSANAPAATVAASTEGKKNTPASTENKKESTAAVETYESAKAEPSSPAKNSEKPKPADKSEEKAAPVSKDSKYEYVTDSTYVNGVLKIKKRKVKKQ